jgi:hypothetical protein
VQRSVGGPGVFGARRSKLIPCWFGRVQQQRCSPAVVTVDDYVVLMRVPSFARGKRGVLVQLRKAVAQDAFLAAADVRVSCQLVPFEGDRSATLLCMVTSMTRNYWTCCP